MCGELVIIGMMVGRNRSRIITFDDDHGRWQPLFIPLALSIIAAGPSSGHYLSVLAWRSSGVRESSSQPIRLRVRLRLHCAYSVRR